MSAAVTPHRARSLIIWTIVAVIALIAIFIGIDSASKQPKSQISQADSLPAVQNDDHAKTGNFSSPITLIEYSDFQCPACATYYPLTKKLAETNSAKVRFIYRYMPLSAIHKNAMSASLAAEAASKQNKFWEMHDILFERQSEWSDSTNSRDIFTRYAEELRLDVKQFLADFEDKLLKTRVERDYEGGIRAGVEGTPTFFLNGKKIENPRSYDEFQKRIDEMAGGA